MALIACPECASQVSSLAAACPKCAAPIAGSSAAQAVGQQVTTTELTAKKFKKQQLLGAAMMIAGFVLLFGGGFAISDSGVGIGLREFLGFSLLVAGVVMAISAKARAWWHHG